MDIEKLALEFLQESPVKQKNAAPACLEKKAGPKRKRNRAAVVKQYERYVKRYAKEKAIVDQIMAEATELRKKYDAHQQALSKFQKTMIELRDVIHKMDDEGKDFIEIALPDPEDASSSVSEESSYNSSRKNNSYENDPYKNFK